jgi:MFS family permease
MPPASFVRDRFTWLAYVMLGYYAYLLNGLGPAMPFLRAEMTLSYTLGSLHFSAFAVGLLTAGLTGDTIARRLGRPRLFWLAALSMAAGTLVLLLGRHPLVTIGAAFLMGALGSYLLVLIPAMLADRYGEQRAVAFSEANVVAVFFGGLSPLAVGGLAQTALGWRGALMLAVAAVALLAALGWRVPLPKSLASTGHVTVQAGRLPGVYWLYWLVLVLVVAVEFCAVFWAATFFETEIGLARTQAASLTSLFLMGMVVGRALGSWLVRRLPAATMLFGALAVCAAGYFLHWWFTLPWLAVCGLFVAGLGTANLYPLTLSLAVGAAPGLSDVASARASLASGTAILALPLLLGSLADSIGLRPAYSVVFLLLMLASASVWIAQRVRSSQPVAEAQ